MFVTLSWSENGTGKSSSFVLSIIPQPHPDPNLNWELVYEEYRISKGDTPKFKMSAGGPVVIPEAPYI
jgi:hypothetical protein